VNCFANDICDGFFDDEVARGVTQEACCSNLMDPVGYSYQGDSERCRRCPIGECYMHVSYTIHYCTLAKAGLGGFFYCSAHQPHWQIMDRIQL
jgi:hypothetical protein